jgi:hypothetical protein
MEKTLVSRVLDEVRQEATYLNDLIQVSEQIPDLQDRQKLHECVGKLRLVLAELATQLVKRYPDLDAGATDGR